MLCFVLLDHRGTVQSQFYLAQPQRPDMAIEVQFFYPMRSVCGDVANSTFCCLSNSLTTPFTSTHWTLDKVQNNYLLWVSLSLESFP